MDIKHIAEVVNVYELLGYSALTLFSVLILSCVTLYLFDLNIEAWRSIIGHTKIGTAIIGS